MNLRGSILVLASLVAACSSGSFTGAGDGAGGNGGGDPNANGGAPGGTSGDTSGATSGGGDGTGSGGTTSGGGGGGTSGGGAADGGVVAGEDGGGTAGGVAGIKTVFLILMENHNWATPTTKAPEVIKGNSMAPYINGTLLPMGAHAEKYYDNPKAVHPSEPNYIWLEAGDNLGITSDSDPSVNHQATTQHLVTLLENAGVSWKSYQENVTAGSCPVATSGLYAPKHNPMVFFDDVVGNPPSTTNARCIAHVRPFTELATDLQQDKVAQYNFLTPNLCNDMHNTGCGTGDQVKNGDVWLSQVIPQILASQAYRNGGAIFITWDESEGGEVPIGMIVLSPLAKKNYANTTTKYFHSSMLRTVQEIFHVQPLLRDAANQPDLSDLFTAPIQ